MKRKTLKIVRAIEALKDAFEKYVYSSIDAQDLVYCSPL